MAFSPDSGVSKRSAAGLFVVAAAVVGVLVGLAACNPASGPLPDDPGQAATVASTLDVPWSIAFAGDTALVSERDSGAIVELRGDHQREIGVVPGVAAAGEGGLLGIATRDGWLFAYFTTDSDNRIARFPLRGAPGSYSIGPAEVLVRDLPKARNHNGGRIAFGPDGMLYATVGDAGDPGSAQDLRSSGGKVLRMTPDGGRPADNPFPGSLVYSYGHRNPQGLAWAADGTLYASEFGQDTWDELNVIRSGGNYGWPIVEGIGGRSQFVDPVQQWPTSEASPSGMTIIGGRIYVANLKGQRLRVIPLDDAARSSELYLRTYGRLRDAVRTPAGQLWIVTSNTDGRGSPKPLDDRILAVPLDG